MQRDELEKLSREQLIAHAERLGVPRPRRFTQPELIDEIISRTATSERERRKARGWLGRARDLLANVVERGLHLPEAARVLRSSPEERTRPAPPRPFATVTLAEIYASQGHVDRAIEVLDEILARDPEHPEALAMRARLTGEGRGRKQQKDQEEQAAPSEEQAPAAEEPAQAEAQESEEETPAPLAELPQTKPQTKTEAKTEQAGPVSPKTPRATRPRITTTTAPEVPVTLDEGALPDRYDVDEIVALAVDPRTLYFYWEVRPKTLARAQSRRPGGQLCVRIASVAASWEGPIVETRDEQIDSLHGDRFVGEIKPGSNIRVSIGWRDSDHFEPFAVGVEVTAPHVQPFDVMAHEVARWEPRVGKPMEPPRAVAPLAIELEPEMHQAIGEARTSFTQEAQAAIEAQRETLLRWPTAPLELGLRGAPRSEPSMQATPSPVAEREGAPEAPSSWWFEPGGASELGRGGAPSRGAEQPPTGLGGASELYRGGASELCGPWWRAMARDGF